MKVLFLEHPEADFMAGLLYLGLCQELGAENVVDYPFKKSYHGETDSYPSFYTQGELGSTAPFNWLQTQTGRAWSREEVIDRIAEFDLTVLASPRKNNTEILSDLIGAVGRQALRLILVDGEDYTDIRTDLIERFTPHVYFKRELMPDTPAPGIRVVPFPLSSPVPPQPLKKKDIDVLFIGGVTWPARTEACEALRRVLGNRFVGGTNVRYDYDQYIDAIARSKIAISVRGHGYDTLRYWEIPSCAETLLIADQLPVLRPHPFQNSMHAMYFSSLEMMISNVQRALSSNLWRTRVARAGNGHLRSHHTVRARARQLLEESLK